MKLEQILALRQHEQDHFCGDSPHYAWGGLYGGQLIAQAIMAAGATLAAERLVHSVHAHFIRRGQDGQPVSYRVERERDGGRFSTRLVHAYQGDRRLLAATLSFGIDYEVQGRPLLDMGDIPQPDELEISSDWFSQFQRRGLPARSQGRLSSAAWFQLADAVPSTALHQAAALAFLSDDLPTEAVLLGRSDKPRSIEDFFSASLDHSLWFHALPRLEDGLLVQMDCTALNVDRGLAQGQAYDRQGRLMASVSQEVLLRSLRDAESS